jgi:solute carrier family 25 carnitine/acylcarnitine transporter 20/29
MECALTNGYQRKPEMKDWVAAGAFSGIFSSIATGPTELVSRIAAVDVNSQGTLRDEMNIIKKIWRSHGVSGLFQGLGLTAFRDSLFFVSYFSIYKGLLPEENPSVMDSFWAGGISGSVSWGLLHPVDVIKTRWQVAPKGDFASPMQLVKHCYRKEGAKFMLQGLNATVVRAFPQHAVTFVVYEYLSKLRAQNSCL